jgi:hypothetical protein
VASLLQANDIVRAGRTPPAGSLSPKRLAKMTMGDWLILSRAGKVLGREASILREGAADCSVLEVAEAEPPRLFGLFRLKAEPAVRWTPVEQLEGTFRDGPVDTAECTRGHPALAARLVPMATEIRSRVFPGKLRRPPRSQRYIPPTPTREALLLTVDRSLVERYALEEEAADRKRRPPRSPLKFSDGYPAKDLSSAIRLLVTARAAEVADRMRNGTLAGWFREEAGEVDLAAVVDAATHTARDRGVDDDETRAILLRYIRRTPVGADLERGLIEPMAEALRSRDGALVASTAQALLLLDADMAAAELASALFETEVAGRPHVISALGETGSPRGVNALERLAKAATRSQDRDAAIQALSLLATEGAAKDVATAALKRLGGP